MSLIRRLSVLKYPFVGAFDILDWNSVASLIIWIEDVKIRMYKIEDRKHLRSLDDNWWNQFVKYIKDLECPIIITYDDVKDTSKLNAVLLWVSSYALGLDYEEQAKEINRASSEFVALEMQKSRTDTNIMEALKMLAHKLNCPQVLEPSAVRTISTSDKNVQIISILENVIVHLQSQNEPLHDNDMIVEKTEDDVNSDHAGGVDDALSSFSVEKTTNSLAGFPLGFVTNDEDIDNAALILKLLYVEDLRVLQSDVNKIIEIMQSFTSNPKTNTALGKVGR